MRFWLDPDTGDVSLQPIWVGEFYNEDGDLIPIRLEGGPGNTPLYTYLA